MSRKASFLSENPSSGFHERESAWLYRRVSAVETDPRKQALFDALAAAAERQAQHWDRLQPPERPFQPTLRARSVGLLLKLFGPRPLRPALAALKLRGLSVYERGHLTSHAMPTSVDAIGQRHKRMSGGNLRAAVFGVNDGLISNTGLLMGVAGAGADSPVLLMSGAAGLLAGALSMAAGEYVSVRSQREMYEYQIGLERDELKEYPEEEAEELALIYNARGMSLEQAREVSRQLLANPEHALDTLAREELGLNPDDLGSPWGAALFSFTSFAGGAVLPLLPWLFGASGRHGLTLTIGIAAVALFLVGMTISLFTGRSAFRNGLRMVAIGAAAGVVTWLIGSFLAPN